jgi:hypothetical protein
MAQKIITVPEGYEFDQEASIIKFKPINDLIAKYSSDNHEYICYYKNGWALSISENEMNNEGTKYEGYSKSEHASNLYLYYGAGYWYNEIGVITKGYFYFKPDNDRYGKNILVLKENADGSKSGYINGTCVLSLHVSGCLYLCLSTPFGQWYDQKGEKVTGCFHFVRKQ